MSFRSRHSLRIRGLMLAGASFSPSRLFASGEPGGWYDIDPAYLYQDSAGTTPVTAPGQTVGMVLDRSKGLVLGPELVTNGDFSNGSTGWITTSWVVSGGVATITNALDSIAQNVSFTAGRLYRVTYTVTAFSGTGGVRPRFFGGTTVTGTTVSAPGTYTEYLYAVTGNTQVAIASTSNTCTVSIDNISVKELPGNHLTQSTLSNRAIYGIEPFGGRRNLLTYTEQFDNAAWTKSNVTATASVLTETTATGFHNVQGNYSNDGASKTWAVSVEVKANGRDFAWIDEGSAAGAAFTVNLTNGSVNLLGAAWTSVTVTAVGDGWYRVVGIMTRATSLFRYKVGPALDASTLSYVGDASKGIQVRNAQLEISSTATAYQRVTDQWNVTEAGKTSVGYLQFDGSDDWLVSPTITPGIDKAQVFAGVRKLSDAALGVVAETSVSAAANNGAFFVLAPTGASPSYRFDSRGTNQATAQVSAGYPAPITNILTGIGDIAADTAILRANGAAVASSAADQGTGNYLAYPLYVGRRGGTTLPYNGRLYSLIVRFGANLDAATITQTENWVAGKTGIYTVDQLNRLNARAADGTLYSAYAAADASSNNYLVTNSVRAADGTSYNVI